MAKGLTTTAPTGCHPMRVVLYASRVRLDSGRNGTCVKHWTSVASALATLALKAGVPMAAIIEALAGNVCYYHAPAANKPACGEAAAAMLRELTKAEE